MSQENLLDHMSYESLTYFRKNHPAWRLMVSRNSAFISSFLYREFINDRNREVSETVLMTNLDIYMETIGFNDEFTKSAKDYLQEWASDDYGLLRSFYPLNSDEVHYDLTSAAQKAIEWILDLKQANFIGTESRLILVFELLQQIVKQTQTDPKSRIAELEEQKSELEREIQRVKDGNIKVLQPTQVKERFMQATSMSHEILSDFRAVEQRFRELSRSMREKIAVWDKGKGELVGSYFADQSNIYNSDQGKSFQAFFDFLMSGSSKDELENVILKLKEINELSEEISRSGIEKISEDWLEGSRYVWATVESMSEQLSRYVDESFLEEERRINQVIKSIERNAISISDYQIKGMVMQIDLPSPTINLAFDRRLFNPPKQNILIDEKISLGEVGIEDEVNFLHVYVDRDKLKGNIENMFVEKKCVSFIEVVEKYPLEEGLSEFLAYLSLDKLGIDFEIDNKIKDKISWYNEDGEEVIITSYRVNFYKKEE